MHNERHYPRKKLDRKVMCFTENNREGEMVRSYFFATLVDVSENGIGLQTEQDCNPGDDVWLHESDVALECVPGKVIWTKKSGNSNNLGLCFSVH